MSSVHHNTFLSFTRFLTVSLTIVLFLSGHSPALGDAAISVRNLFNEDAKEPSPDDLTAPNGAWIVDDYPLSGREIRALN